MQIDHSIPGATGLARRASSALVTGSIFVVFSESLFWGATGPAGMGSKIALGMVAGAASWMIFGWGGLLAHLSPRFAMT